MTVTRKPTVRCAALGCHDDGWVTIAATVTQGDRAYDDILHVCEAHSDLLAVGFQLARAGRASV